MSASSFSKTKLIVAGSAGFVALALPMLQDGSFNSPISLISGAYAAEQGQGKGGSDAQRGKGGAGEKAGGGAQKEGRGNAIDKRVFRQGFQSTRGPPDLQVAHQQIDIKRSQLASVTSQYATFAQMLEQTDD